MDKQKLNYYCKDCNKKISYRSALYGLGICIQCVGKRRIGKNNPMFGKKRPDLSERNKIFHPDLRGNKNGMFGRKGELSPNFKNAIELHKKYCIDCGKELSKSAYCNEYQRCMHCASLYRLEIYGNPNTIHGHSSDPYPSEFNDNLKEKIRNRDNYKCQICNKYQEQELIDFNWRLSVHHIDYNKENCEPDNLITLCLRCHLRTNINRKTWEEMLCQKMMGV